MMVLALVLSGCITVSPALKSESTSENDLENSLESNSENKTSRSSRFVLYNQDLEVCTPAIINPGYYYIVDIYTDNVYVQKTAGSHVGIFPLYDENGNITKAKDMGITY